MKTDTPQTPSRRTAVTLLELLVVVLIISILATVATGVYTNQTQRARIAATRDLIYQLQIAITRYEMDLGSFPPSASSTVFPAGTLALGSTANFRDGSGLLAMALVHSSSGNSQAPGSTLWAGPYINLGSERLKAKDGLEVIGNFDILDYFNNPLIYIRFQEYAINTGITTDPYTGGTPLFTSTAPSGANPDLPAPNPYTAQGETFYNTASYQLISYGPDGKTLDQSVPPLGTLSFKGAAADDITNFGY